MRSLSSLLLILAGSALLSSTDAPAAEADCLSAPPLALHVRIGAAPPQRVLLIGGDLPALRMISPETGATLWSAGAATPAMQRFAGMTAAFAGSFIALDTDRDGLHDRIYAGDLDGRLWRFDLHNSAAADAFASGGVFADFRNDAGRGFRAPPDVSLATAPGAAPWFDIAVGTAAPGLGDANNRFYVLRDHSPYGAWTDAQYREWTPLHETDLLRMTTAGEPARTPVHAGWFIELHGGDVLTAALTVAGRTVFAIAESSTATSTGCRSAFSIATLDLAQARLLTNADGTWRTSLATDLPTATAFTLSNAVGTGQDASRARCTFGETPVPDCDVDLRPRRTWWRREDAE